VVAVDVTVTCSPLDAPLAHVTSKAAFVFGDWPGYDAANV
jgi:hypothetical protein